MDPFVVHIVLLLAAAGCLFPSAIAQFPFPFPINSAQQATEFCLEYAFPLPIFAQSIGGAAGIKAGGTNQLHNNTRGDGNAALSRRFAGPVVNAVVRPNTDTVYTGLLYDLAQEDVILTVPPMQNDRVYVFAFYDPYGDNFANIGNINGNSPGNYLLQPALMSGNYGISTQNCPGYVACINSPTLNGRVTIRVEKKNNTTKDQQYINQYVGQIKVAVTNTHSATAPSLSASDFENLSSDTTVQALQLLARLSSRNPPQNVALAKQLPSIELQAGIVNGVYLEPLFVNTGQAESDLAQNITNFVQDPTQNIPLSNGWFVVSPSLSGSFSGGTDLIARSYIAQVLYLELTADQAIYVAPAQNVAQTFSLASGEAYLLTFSGKPPIGTPGFWSLTMYNAAGFLAANKQGILALGDRSNLTYPNGQQVYGSNQSTTNGPFQILIQSTTDAPPANWTNNWLPSPAGGKPFNLVLRLYGSGNAGTDGSYVYPTFVKQAAL